MGLLHENARPALLVRDLLENEELTSESADLKEEHTHLSRDFGTRLQSLC
jgi:hypothetical protein